MRRWLTAPVPLWTLLLLALFSLIVIGGVAGSNDDTRTAAKTTSTSTTTTTEGTTTTTAPTTTTEPTTTTVPQPVTVLDVSGANKTNSDNFTVIGRWTIHAEVSGGAGAAVAIKTANGESVDYISFDGPGDSAQRGSGTFYLEISPFGASFHILVIDDPG